MKTEAPLDLAERCRSWNADRAHQVDAGRARARRFTLAYQQACGHAAQGYKPRSAPSTEALRQHRRDLARIVDAHRAAPQAALIAQLNLVIRGWTNY